MDANKLLSEIVAYRTYAKYLPHLQRRETFEETVNRCMNMHLERFPKLSGDIVKAFGKVHNYQLMPAMRTLQFAADAIKKNNIRSYNCSFLPIDNVRAFGESLFLLLSGTGVGFSVQKHHTEQLPIVKLPKEEGVFVVHDSIEGWSQAVDMLMEAYLYRRIRPIYDFTFVRPKGAYLSTTGAKAPGPEPLRILLSKVEERLKLAVGRKLRPIEVHDIICILSEGVLAGGVRRSSLISLFDRTDEEMLKCKSGEWWSTAPWRARANNSMVLPRWEVTQEEFYSLFKYTQDSGAGEPGFFWTNDTDLNVGTNPCQPSYAKLLTPEGIKQLKDVNIGDRIWDGSKWVYVLNKWSTGVKPVFKYTTSTGNFIGTENHRIVENDKKVEVVNANSIDWALGPITQVEILDSQDIMDGLVIGDGSIHKASNNLQLLYIGDKDQDYFESEVSSLIIRERFGISDKAYEVKTTIVPEELPYTYLRSVPDRFYYGSQKTKKGFLRGLFSANGSYCGGRITLKQTSKILVQQVQEMLSSLGIHSYITINKSKDTQFSNGMYTTKQSYDLNITSGKDIFKDTIGFIQKYKQDKITNSNKPKFLTSDIKEIEYLEDCEVFDITVDSEEHVYWTGGCLVSNCAEVSLNPFQFCNLSTVNQTGVTTKKEFLSRIHSATLIGTLQASYTDFPYIRDIWRETTEKEALVGVSFTGIADADTDISKEWLEEGAKFVLELNEKYAKKIGINPAARTTLVKPEGTSSIILGSSSGVHARHSQYYIRRIRMSANDSLAVYLRHKVPELMEEDVSTSNTIIFSAPQQSPSHAVLRGQETAMELFKRTLKYNKHWIYQGHRYGENYHNVSVTISVKEHEWDELKEALWNERKNYNAVSLLPFDGGTYQQAPFEECNEEQYNKMEAYIEQQSIDLRDVKEVEDFTDRMSIAACAGGACEIV